MSTPYVRRPNLEGNTDVPVQVQPYLQGTVRKTSAGIVPGFAALVATDAADLVVESDLSGGGPITVTFTPGHSDLLTDIISTINGYVSGAVTASERDGCLRIQTDGVGETVLGVKSFIRVYPATNNYLGTGIPQDCAPLFGFACHPDPAATVTAGDIESAATRPVEQGNLPGTRFVARGEDRTSAAFNRALSQLALNADVTRTAAVREAYYPVEVELDFNDAYAAGWLRFDASGNTTQIKLSALSDLFPLLTGRLYVGNLSNTSTLREIAKYWSVSDVEGRALSVYDAYYETTRTLRIGAVTRGEQGFGRMHFPDEDSAPTSTVPDTQYVVADGRNALGVSRLKQPTAAITEIRGRTNVVCGSLATPAVTPTSTTSPTAGVGFKSHGVTKGDIAVIASATVTSPFCHNGTYYVEDVVSEQELILRPIADTDVESLNPSDAGSFGEITIYSSKEWEAEAWVTLDPPLPRFPNNKLVISFGLERETLNQREDVYASYTDTSAVPENVELTAFQGLQFRQRQSLGGAYAGMSADRTADAGSIIKERTRPVTLVAPEKTPPSAGTYVRGPFSGSLLGDGVLAALGGTPPTYDDTFTIGDVGRVVKLSGVGVLFDQEPFLITEFIDGAHVRLSPLGALPGVELSNYGAATYEVYDDVVDYPTPLLTLIAPEMDRDGRDLADVGVLYIREQNDAAPPYMMPTRRHGRSLLHLERVAIGHNSGTASDLLFKLITSNTATTVTLPINIEAFQNIFAVEGGDTRPVEPPYNGGSVFRIINGPNAGFYLLQKTTSAGELTLRTLDGDPVSLDTSVTVDQFGVFYNAHVSIGHTLAGAGYGDVAYRTAKLRVFFDSLEQGEEAGVGLSLDWRGQGAGIAAQLNDADFVAYDSGAGAIGYFQHVKGYAPAHGELFDLKGATSGDLDRRSVRGGTWVVESNSRDLAVFGVTSDTPNAWAGWFAQTGLDGTLVVTKVEPSRSWAYHTAPANGAPLELGDMAPTAALSVIYDGTSQARNAAIDVVGSIYQRTRETGSVDQGDVGHGGIFSESGVGAGRWAHPIPSGVPFIGILGLDGSRPTTLGEPGVMYPYTGAAPVNAATLPPDYGRFNQPHNGFIVLPADALDRPWSRWVGQRAHVDYPGIGVVTHEICSVVVNGPMQYVAVYNHGFADLPNNPGVTVWISGERWERAYVNVADYAFVGTHDTSTDSEKAYLPFITSAETPSVSRVPTPIPGGFSHRVDGLLSPPRIEAGTAGVGVGAVNALSDAPLTAGKSLAGYTETYVDNVHIGDWQYDAEEPRSGYPNKGISIGGINNSHPGVFPVDDVSVTYVSHGCDIAAGYSPLLGGSLHVHASGGTGDSVARVWSYPFTLSENVYAVRAHVIMNPYLSPRRNLVLALRRTDGTLIAASHTYGVNGDEVQEIDHTFDLCDLVQRGGDALSGEVVSACLTLDVQIKDTENPAYVVHSGFYLMQLAARPLAKVLRAGSLSVDGLMTVGVLRASTAVKGYSTVGPAQAGWLINSEYALVDGAGSTSVSAYQEYASQEGRTGFIVVGGQTYSLLPEAGRYFNRGRHSAAIVGYHPAFDPFFFRHSVDIADGVVPGRTGFVLPVEIPHGARIVSISHMCSLRPCYSNNVGSGATASPDHSDFQVWHTDPFASSAIPTTADNKPDWDSSEGYRITLFRQNCVPFDVEMEQFTTSGALPEGFAEPLWTKIIDLSSTTEPAAADLEEHSIKDFSALFDTSAATIPAYLIADRRQYDYFVTIEFYIGCRVNNSGVYEYRTGFSPVPTTLSLASGAEIGATPTGEFRSGVFSEEFPRPPVFKFRGLRVGWVNDRVGNGGWG